ncbi:glycosyltransferase [Brytella acorum]|uniref:Glycosyltransferase n=1 Tax=Brytella acorum TaxID=2959299 RepID=A0AA35UQD9_9PROT|nr:glycosyltransferase [Brytella acorum]MDF3624872.1 glycosyltransferase [Brytella acorum]CAI9120176.1 glycosyltransferase [Brytella acorum]
MTIGVVIHDFSLGGSERIAIRLANYWSEQGHDVTVFCGREHGQMLGLVSKTVKIVTSIPVIVRGRNSVQTLAYAAQKYFTLNPVDFCYVPGNYHWPVSYRLGKIPISSRPIIVSQISSLIYKPNRKPIFQKLFNFRMRILLKKSDVVVAMDPITAQQSNAILGRDDTIVIPLPALPVRSFPLSDLPSAVPYSVMAAGRLTEQKGFDTLINAFRLVVNVHPEARLTIYGEGEDRSALEFQIETLQLQNNVHLFGYVSNIIPFLKENSLFVLSSRREGYGAVLLEALDAGCRIVTTDCTPAIRDIFLNTLVGKVVPVDDVLKLSKAIIEELSHFYSEIDFDSKKLDRYRINIGGDLYIKAVRTIKRYNQKV